MKYLILINREFPYKKGEAYLENEINEITDYFDKIYIYPSDATKKETPTRFVNSEKIKLINYESKSLRFRKVLYVLGSIKFVFSEENEGKKIINRLEEAYFLNAAYSQFNKIKKDIKENEISKDDEIYLYSYWLYINAKVVTLIKRYYQEKGIKVKAFSRAHGFDIYEERRKFNYLPHRNHLLNGLDYIFPCSNNGRNHIISQFPKIKNKIHTSYLGTYDHGLNKDKNKSNNFVIVSCSWLVEVKRVDLIIKALSHIKNMKIKWIHLGGGPLKDRLEQLAKTELKEIEYKIYGNMKNSEIVNFYKNNHVDLFINVSSSEGLPVSIMEVASFGIPILATDVGGTNEIVSELNGKLIPKNISCEVLAKEINNLILDSKIDKKRKNSRIIWEEKFNARKNYKDFIEKIVK